MSLIQEALKRQQEEKSDAKKAPGLSIAPASKPDIPPPAEPSEILPGISALPPIAPPSPAKPSIQRKSAAPANQVPAVPPPSVKEEKKEEKISNTPPSTQIPVLQNVTEPKRSRKIVVIAGVLAFLAVFFVFSKKGDDAAPVADDTSELAAETIPTPAEPVAGEPETRPGPTPPVAKTPDTTTLKTAEARPAAQPQAQKTQDDVVTWPTLTLTSVMGKGTKGSALINGELIGVGDNIEGVKFKSVGQGGIYLEYQGKTRFLKRGQTTY